MENKGVLSNLKFIFSATVLFVLMFLAVLATVLNMYKPTYKVSIGDSFVGYFGDELQFEEVYNTLVLEKEQVDPNVKVYLEKEPQFETCYIRDSLIASQNVYTSLREYVKTEYTVYHVSVKNENKMVFNSKDEADKYVANLKKELPKIKSEVIEEKVEALGTMTTIELADNILKDVVSRNRPVVRIPVYKYTSSDTGITAPADVANASAAEGGVWPTTSRYVSSPYGWRGSSLHTGMDIAGRSGDPIYAYKTGVVTFSGWGGDYGYLVKIDHGNGIVTYYAHNSKLLVSAGQKVNIGQTIALQGTTGNSTGNHVHFEYRINGAPVNPYSYIIGK